MTQFELAFMAGKPWDQRLAHILVRPLASTPVHPNHLTTLGLLSGMASAGLFAFGGPETAGWAALLFMIAVFIDHTDGELAHMTGKTTEFGHHFDYVVGAANYTMLFIAIGIGLAAGEMGGRALALGLAAGLSNPVIVVLRMGLERRHGAKAVAHPRYAGVEIEDFIYLIGPITWVGGLEYFFLVYGFGTFGYLTWTLWEVLKPREEAVKSRPAGRP